MAEHPPDLRAVVVRQAPDDRRRLITQLALSQRGDERLERAGRATMDCALSRNAAGRRLPQLAEGEIDNPLRDTAGRRKAHPDLGNQPLYSMGLRVINDPGSACHSAGLPPLRRSPRTAPSPAFHRVTSSSERSRPGQPALTSSRKAWSSAEVTRKPSGSP